MKEMVWVALENYKSRVGKITQTHEAAEVIKKEVETQGLKLTKGLVREAVKNFNKYNKDNQLKINYILENIF